MGKTWRIVLILLLAFFPLFACGKKGDHTDGKTVTLRNQAGEEVTVPAQKPALLFFFTTYT